MSEEGGPPVTPLLLVVSFGIFGNVNIILASVRIRKLRSPCNILIAILAFADIVHQAVHYLLFYFYVIKQSAFTSLEQCFYLESLPMWGYFCGNALLLLIALDRLFCLLRPVKYKRVTMNTVSYITLIFSLPMALFFILHLNAFIHTKMDGLKMVLCEFPNGYPMVDRNLMYHTNLFVVFVTIIVYVIIWLYVKRAKSSFNKQILWSITVVTVLVLSGWIITSVIMTLSVYLEWDINRNPLLTFNAGLFINASISSNYPIYFWMSSDYRKAFKQQLKLLFCRKVIKDEVSVYAATTTHSHIK